MWKCGKWKWKWKCGEQYYKVVSEGRGEAYPGHGERLSFPDGPHATVTWSPTRHHAANTTIGQEKIGALYTIPFMGVGMKMILHTAELESVEGLLTL